MEVVIGILQRAVDSYYIRFQFDVSFFSVMEKWTRDYQDFSYSPLYRKGKHRIIPGLLEGYLYQVRPRATRGIYKVYGDKRSCFLDSNTFQTIIQNGLLWLPTPKRTSVLARKGDINVNLSISPFPLTVQSTTNPIFRHGNTRLVVKLSQLLGWLNSHPIDQYNFRDCILGIDWAQY